MKIVEKTYINRKKIFAIMCIFIIFLLSSCGNSNTNSISENEKSDDELLTTTYVINNLSYKYEDEENETGCIEISGLEDKDVEKKINAKISEKYKELQNADIPEYRGIKAKFGSNPEITDEEFSSNMSVYVAGNYNNILSVVISKSECFKTLKEPAMSEFVIQDEPLNFDLNTGEEIKLKDVFNDNVDGISIMSDYVYDEIINNSMQEEDGNSNYAVGNELTLMGKYSGLNENQKFYFNYSPDIVLIFDYETPEFYTGYNGFQTVNMEIPISSDMDFLDKWYDENKNIFISKEPVSKALIEEKECNYLNDADKIYLLDDGNDNDNFCVSVYSSYPKGLSEKMKNNMTKDIDLDITSISKILKPYAEKMRNKYGVENSYCVGDKNLNILRFGKYYDLIYNQYSFVGSDTGDAEFVTELDVNKYICKVYKEGREKPLEIKDIFSKKVDYKKILIDCFCKELQRTISDYSDENSEDYNFGYGKYAKKDREYVEILVDNITGFQIRDRNIEIIYNDLKDTKYILEKVYGDELVNLPMYENDYFFVDFVDYKDIGADNLVIFD